MPSNSDEIVQQMQQAFQALVTDVTGADAQAWKAYTAELTMCVEARGKPMIRPKLSMRIAPRE